MSLYYVRCQLDGHMQEASSFLILCY